jgi:sugar phosphate isomerase/epimerase
MIKSCVTISLVPSLAGGPWVYWDDLEVSIAKAKAAGFDGVELFTASADAVNRDTLWSLVEEHGIKVAAVGTGAGRALHGLHLTSPDKEVRRQACDFIKAMIDFGGRFGAAAIIGSMGGCVEEGVERERAVAWLSEGVGALAARAAARGVKLFFEPLNRYETNLINRLGDGLELVKSVGRNNVFLLADLFHMNIEEDSITGALEEAAGYIGHVHFVDSNRRAAGMGHIDLGRVGWALREIGFEGYASAEALAWPDPDTAAAQTMAAFRRFLLAAYGPSSGE